MNEKNIKNTIMKHYLSKLQYQFVQNWNRPALCNYHGESFTFGEVAKEIVRFHVLFKTLGIKKGDRIAICARNQARWGVVFLAINTYEAVVVPLLADFTSDNIQKFINHSESILLFTDKDIASHLDMNILPRVRLIINVSNFEMIWGSSLYKTAYQHWEEYFSEAYPHGISSANLHFPTLNDKDLAVINYTSGSTGDPKGVMLRYECLSANIEYAQKVEPSGPSDRLLSVLPMAHIFGMSFDMLYPLCGGTSIFFLLKIPSPSILMKALKEIKPFHFTSVPMVYEKIYTMKIKPLLDKPIMKPLLHIPFIRNVIYDLIRSSIDKSFGNNIRVYVMGGAAINPEIETFFKKIKLHFSVGYGMTEAGPLLAYSKWNSFMLHSCGRAMDFIQLRVKSADPEHLDGEIQAKGLNIFSGYYKNPKATKASFTEDGWFNTGDMGTIDNEGNVFLKGRCKNMLLSSNGQNIYPEEIECVVCSLPQVKECIIVQRNNKLVALTFLDADAFTNKVLDEEELKKIEKDIKTNANVKLPKHCAISEVEFMKEPFEKTPKLSIKRHLYK